MRGWQSLAQQKQIMEPVLPYNHCGQCKATPTAEPAPMRECSPLQKSSRV